MPGHDQANLPFFLFPKTIKYFFTRRNSPERLDTDAGYSHISFTFRTDPWEGKKTCKCAGWSEVLLLIPVVGYFWLRWLMHLNDSFHPWPRSTGRKIIMLFFMFSLLFYCSASVFMNTSRIKAYGYISMFSFSSFLQRGNNFYGLFVSLDDISYLKWGLLLNERICSLRSKFFALWVNLSQKGLQKWKWQLNT